MIDKTDYELYVIRGEESVLIYRSQSLEEIVRMKSKSSHHHKIVERKISYKEIKE